MPVDKISRVALSSITWDTPPRQFKHAISSLSPDAASSGISSTINQVQKSSGGVLRPVFSAPPLTTVAGKSYSLSIEKAAGTFVASVPNPPGISATGSSAQAAEKNLDAKLDTLA
jgi:hypothetical protein